MSVNLNFWFMRNGLAKIALKAKGVRFRDNAPDIRPASPCNF